MSTQKKDNQGWVAILIGIVALSLFAMLAFILMTGTTYRRR